MEKLNWTIDKLWNGCILKSITHAIMVAYNPFLSFISSWDDFNYNIEDANGTTGTVTFYKNYCIGAFRNEMSDRFNSTKITDAVEFFKNAPNEIIQLSQKETLQYLLLDIKGDIRPVITTAFWGSNNELYTSDSFGEFLYYGGELLEIQTMDFDSALSAVIDNYNLEPNQVQLLLQIYARKIENPNSPIILSKKEIEMIGIDDPEGLKESWTSFKEMNIDWEIKPWKSKATRLKNGNKK
jgi:hypothetical protein